MKIDKQCFGNRKDAYLGVCYATLEGSHVETVDVFNKFTNDLIQFDELHGDNYIASIAGDFNARATENVDFIKLDNCEHY